MTLNQIFDNIMYGEKYMKEKAIKEEIERCVDREIDLFYASKRAKQLSGKVALTESEEQKINRIISKVSLLEDRIENGKTMSVAYRKMQTTSIMDDCKALIEEATKVRKADTRKLEILSGIVASTKYFVESQIDENAALKESSNPLFNKFMEEERKNIENVI